MGMKRGELYKLTSARTIPFHQDGRGCTMGAWSTGLLGPILGHPLNGIVWIQPQIGEGAQGMPEAVGPTIKEQRGLSTLRSSVPCSRDPGLCADDPCVARSETHWREGYRGLYTSLRCSMRRTMTSCRSSWMR